MLLTNYIMWHIGKEKDAATKQEAFEKALAVHKVRVWRDRIYLFFVFFDCI